MANNNVQNVRFLRNGTLFTTRELAKNALTGFTLTAEMDGSVILARYTDSEANAIKTLMGLVYFKDASNKSITIFDIDDASTDVKEYIESLLGDGVDTGNTVTEQLEALSGSTADTSADTSVEGAKRYADELIDGLDYTGVTTGTGVYVTNVTEANGIVSATTATLPDASTVSGDSKVVIDVTQDKGAITATAANLTGVKLDGYAEAAATGDVASTDTLGEALGKLQKTIHEMDKDADAVAGQVVTTVSEADGKVTETKANVKDLQLGGYVKDTGATGDIASTDTINAALSKLENKSNAITIANADGSINVTTAATGTDINVNIKSGEHVLAKDGGNGIYTDLDFVKITSGLPETIKERYQLLATDDSQIGVNIDVPKDSHIVSINYITTGEHAQNLEYVYVDVSGNTQTTYVDMSELVLETEFASGVTVTDHIAHGVVDPTSEKVALTYDAQGASATTGSVLTVDANGFKVSNVQTAIDAKVAAEIGKLDATGGTQTIATDKHVAVEVIEADGKITAVTVVEDNIADADDLTQEIADRQSGDTELSNRLGTGVTTANTATAQLVALSGDSATAQSGDTSVEGAKRYADAKLDDVVGDLDATVTGATSGNHVTISIEELDGKLVQSGLTIEESDIASASDLDDEIAARKAVDGVNGDAYTADTNANYISGASSLYGADQALDTALKDLADDAITGATMNGTALTPSNNVLPFTATASTSAGTSTSTEAIVITTDNAGGLTFALGTIDCGTY